MRVRPAQDRDIATEKIAQVWLLIEWPQDEKAPTKFWLSTLNATVIVTHLIHTTKMRWRIERATFLLKMAGIETGGRARAFRVAKLVRVSSPRHVMYRGLRLPGVREGRFSPPRKRARLGTSKSLPFPKVTAQGALPTRTERHVPDSIATLRRELCASLTATLERCTCCSKIMPRRRSTA